MLVTLLLIFNLFLLESLLSVDNAVVLAVMVKHLPEQDSKKALRYGLIGAYVMRGACLLCASYLVNIWWLKASGGLYLIYLCYSHFTKHGGAIEENKSAVESGIYRWLIRARFNRLFSTIILVELMDMAFSMDNIFAAAALTSNIWIILTGVFIGIAAMRYVAGWFIELLNRFPFLENTAFQVIGLLGLKLTICGVVAGCNWEMMMSIVRSSYTDLIFSVALMCYFLIPILKNRFSI